MRVLEWENPSHGLGGNRRENQISEMSTDVLGTSFNLSEKVTCKIKAFTQLEYVQGYVGNEMKQNTLNQMLIKQ